MSTNYHTPLETGGPLTAAYLNARLGDLDSGITTVAAAPVLDNLSATTAPGVGDDTGDGYSIGSTWVNTSTDRAYIATDVTLGAAVWKEITFPSSIAANFTMTGNLAVTGTTTLTGHLIQSGGNVSITGGLTQTGGSTSLTGAVTIAGTLAINTSTANAGSTITYTGASSGSVASQLGLVVNDGAAMGSSDRIGQVAFSGYTGAALVAGAFLIGRTTETWSGSAQGSKIEIYTRQDTTTNLLLALTIKDSECDFLGNVDVGSGKVYKVNGTQVVAARSTGWAAMTGSSNRDIVYDTGTIALDELAFRVKEIQAMLTTHGLIGA